MNIYQDLAVLIAVVLAGFMYYKFSISKQKALQQYAFMMKIFYLVLSLILAFGERDFIIIGDFAFGGRISVMLLIVIEIVDSFVDKKKNNKRRHK